MGKVIHWEFVQEIKILMYYQKLYAPTSIRPREFDAWNSLGFCDTNWSPNPGQKIRPSDNTGLQRNWGKHKDTRFYLIWGCWIQIWNPFQLFTSSFLDMHSVHFVHIRYIKAYMNSGLILILWDLWLIF